MKLSQQKNSFTFNEMACKREEWGLLDDGLVFTFRHFFFVSHFTSADVTGKGNNEDGYRT